MVGMKCLRPTLCIFYFFFFTRLWDFVRSFKVGSDIVRFAFLQQFSAWCEEGCKYGRNGVGRPDKRLSYQPRGRDNGDLDDSLELDSEWDI